MYVYKEDETNRRKIGFSKDVDKNLRTVQRGNPNTIRIEYRLPVSDMRQAEKSLHNLFAADRLRKGEWFNLEDKQLLLLKKIFRVEPTTETEERQLRQLGLR